MTTTVRDATAADAEGIAALGRAVVPATYAPISEEYAAWCPERWRSRANVAGSLDVLSHWTLTREHLDGNAPAAGFYRSHGFAEAHRSVADRFPTLTWVWMRKDL